MFSSGRFLAVEMEEIGDRAVDGHEALVLPADYGPSTMKFTQKSKKGPGWLSLGGEVVNVFGPSRSRTVPFSICGFKGPYRFTLAGQNGEPTNPAVARLQTILPDMEFPSAVEAIKAANRILWRRSFPASLKLLQFDDIDVADLVAEHFEDPGILAVVSLCRRRPVRAKHIASDGPDECRSMGRMGTPND